MTPDGALIAARFLHYAALLSLFGAALFPLYAHLQSKRVSPLIDARLRQVRLAAAGLALVGGVGWFLFASASMAGDLSVAADPRALLTVLEATEFGPLWLVRLALIAVVLAAFASRRSLSPRLGWVVALLAGTALASLAMTGHGRAPGGRTGLLHAFADAAHLLAAGAWLGALLPLGAALAAARREPAPAGAVGELLDRFSGVGLSAVAVLAASGLVNGWVLVGSVDRLATTPYGRLLLVKVGLFGLMVGVAAANRLWITPAFTSGRAADDVRWRARIGRNVLIEQALGLAVLAIVSVLGTLPTPLDA
jgi:putative copper resistance protein D